ncbi:MAG: ABC transporter ATP-binding protein [Acetobacteraceae bacterium]|nr:ABC transporter ATP-binding protein [Acetobacteraceae bacterium]
MPISIRSIPSCSNATEKPLRPGTTGNAEHAPTRPVSAGSSVPAGPRSLLSVQDVVVRFGGVVALGGVSFDVWQDEICGLIGPNGSGKTTCFNCISGIYQFERGDILFDGRSIRGVAGHKIARSGIGRTFQNIALFDSMSARDNVLVGAYPLGRTGFLRNAFRLPPVQEEEAQARNRANDLVELLELEAIAGTRAGSLPFGTRKRIELARALVTNPKLLLLDEPAAGLNHTEVSELATLIGRIRRYFRVTIVLVEHHMSLVMRVSDRVVALEFGIKIAEGLPVQVRSDPEVIRAYLGDIMDAPAA